jgi:hypothetical protein
LVTMRPANPPNGRIPVHQIGQSLEIESHDQLFCSEIRRA